jgi:glycogen(starch) synthase
MRVLRLCSVFQPPPTALTGLGARFDPIGGMQTHTYELSRALDRLGVQQTIVTTRPPTAPRREALGTYGRVIRLGLPIPQCRQFYSWQAAGLFPGLAADTDVIHAHLGEDLAIVPLALRAARRHKRPLVLTIHTSVRHTLAVSGVRSAVLKLLGGRLERRGEKAAQAIITLAPRVAALIRTDGIATPIHVVPSGVASSRLADDAGPTHDPLGPIPRPRVIFVGRLHPQKHVDVLVRAAARMPGVSVVLVGDGPERSGLERLAHRLRLTRRVHFLGFVPHDQVAGLLGAADVLAMPSTYEELGTALLEGMQAGLPIVASDTGGIPQVVEHGRTGLLVTPGDPEALAAALTRILHDRALAASLGKAASREAVKYDWTHLARRVLGVYETVAAGPRDVRPALPAEETPFV